MLFYVKNGKSRKLSKWGYNYGTLLKTYHFYFKYEQATCLCACVCMFTIVTTDEGCPVEGGCRIREGGIGSLSWLY